MHTMTKRQGKSGTIDVKALMAEDEEFLRAVVRTALQEVLEAEMTEALGAEKGERAMGRQGYRSGYYGRTLITRVGKLELRVPQDRTGRFSTELFERYQRSERALVAALAEMYVQGVSTRKVKAITEELCGHSFSASSISAMNQRLDAGLAQFAGRPLAEAFPYLILDARYERVREAGVITSQAVLIAIGIDWDGRRQVLAVELANRESRSSWRFSAGTQGARSVWRRICRRRRSRRPAGGAARGSGRGRLPALLRALPQKRARPCAAQSR
jgi:putative transposase